MSARRALATLALLLALLVGGRARAATLDVTITRGPVVVRAEAATERVATRLAERAARDLARIAEDLPGLPTPGRVEIRVVDDTRELAAVAPPGRHVPPWAVGVAFRGTGIVAVALGRAGVPVDVERTLTHELAHLALDAALGPDVPRWLHEGFAMLHAPDWSPERAEILFGMAWLGGTISLHDLDARFPAEEAPAHRAYAQSLDVLTFLARRGRWADPDDDGDRWALRRFLRALAPAPAGDGLELDRAARRAFGVGLDELFREWRVDLQQRYLFLPVGLFAFVIWLIATVLLVLAWRRRRRQNRARLARWAEAEAEAEARARAWTAWATAAAEREARGEPQDEPPRWLN